MDSDLGDPDRGATEALRLIGSDPRNWVPDRAGIDHNVAVIGGGQTGAAFAFAFRRAGIGKVTVIDEAGDEDQAGIWLTAARMNLLRTPKALPGPELGVTGLGFQAWYEARHGVDAYARIDRIPRLDWAAYLKWYRDFLGIQISYRTKLTRIEPGDGCCRLHLEIDGRPAVQTARKVILATGFTGNGGAAVPGFLTGLPRASYAHTQDAIDFTALRGKTIGVIGAAAAAFDAAGAALEAGAKSVHLFARRDSIAATPITRSRGYPGAYDNYRSLPDAIRWHQAVRFRRAGSTPTTDAIQRAVAFPDFHLYLSAPWTAARFEDGAIHADTAKGPFRCDFVIAGTGYFVDPSARPEIADFAGSIALWKDRYQPSADEADAYLGNHPYLGLAHEYLEKTAGSAPFLKNIHVHNPAGFVSFGLPIGDVPSMKRDIPTVVGRISQDLFLADIDVHEQRMTADVAADFGPDLYASALRG